MREIEKSIQKFNEAVDKLSEGIRQASDELDRDGVIQRFEFTFELFWKTLKRILDHEGILCNSPRQCIKKAFEASFVVESDVYLNMLEDRNRTSHIYDEEMSKDIFERIKSDYVSKLEEAKNEFAKYNK